MKLTCDEATSICDKSQYGEASFFDKIRLSIHIFLCKNCGLYSKQNSIMTKCYEKNKEILKNNKQCLCEEEKEMMEKELKAKI